MRRIMPALFLLAALTSFASFASAQTPPMPQPQPVAPLKIIPEKASLKIGVFTEIKAETAIKKVSWRIPPAFQSKQFDGGKVLILNAPPGFTPGEYILTALVAVADDVVQVDCILTVEGAPLPPQPNPNPNPNPPQPAPDAVFAAKLQALYTAETAGGKAGHKALLIELYQQCSTIARSDQGKTLDDLMNQLTTASRALIPATALVGIRQEIAAWLAKTLPVDRKAAMDAVTVAKVASAFDTLAMILQGVK